MAKVAKAIGFDSFGWIDCCVASIFYSFGSGSIDFKTDFGEAMTGASLISYVEIFIGVLSVVYSFVNLIKSDGYFKRFWLESSLFFGPTD